MLILKILVSYKYYIGEACWKYFIGYVNHFDDEIKPVLIKLPKLSGSIKKFLKVSSFKKNKDKLDEYAEIWNRIKYLIGKYFDVEVIRYNKYKSAKVKPFKDEIRTAFHDKGLPAGETP